MDNHAIVLEWWLLFDKMTGSELMLGLFIHVLLRFLVSGVVRHDKRFLMDSEIFERDHCKDCLSLALVLVRNLAVI